ncbi:MAG TPA: DUF72 domain-containing protein [Chthoniobacterales bacterium]
MRVTIGTAGWSLPRAEQEHFPGNGSHLERYAARFRAVEINSSFHRSHRTTTWTRWRDSVPEDFRFSVKMPKTITHTNQLRDADELVASFLKEAGALGAKMGCLLVQLPPKLIFDAAVAEPFFRSLRARTTVAIACEPRHASWFEAGADQLLKSWHVARAAADPARVPAAEEPGGWRGLSYYRLHGSPKVYYSAYSAEFIAALATRVREDAAAEREVWVIFDNTTLGAATRNALDLSRALQL